MELSNLIQKMFAECKFLDLLYVEDDEEISANIIEMLKGFFNSITVAYDGEEGLKRFNEGKFDIVLTDIMMPKLDGRAMARQIKEIKRSLLCLLLKR
jgi:CheY-like chemotaxis protein